MTGSQPRQAIGLALLVAALAVFAWLAGRVAGGGTLAFDAVIRQSVHQHASPALTTLMRGVSSLGSPLALLLLGTAAFVVLLAAHSRSGAVFFLITMAGAIVLDAALKLGFHRARPAAFFATPDPGSYGFPSGHALIAACYLGVVAALAAERIRSRAARVLVWCAALTMAALIGLSRIYLGLHYPSDVLASYAIAALWLFGAKRGQTHWFPAPGGRP